MKNYKVGSFAWFTKMNEANDEQKETKFFNSKDRYKISLKCEREKTDKRSSAPSRRYEVNEKGLTLAQVVSILKKNDKPGTMKTPGISVNSYTITNETTGKTYTHSERSGKGLYDKGLSNITVSDLKAINESNNYYQEFINKYYDGDITNLTQDEKVQLIQDFLIEDYVCDKWIEVLDNQELGDCQSIVHSISKLNIPGVEPYFGEIKIMDPLDEDWSKGKRGMIMTHHWVTIDGEIFEFSKGTLKNYVNWFSYEDPDEDDAIKYLNIITTK